MGSMGGPRYLLDREIRAVHVNEVLLAGVQNHGLVETTAGEADVGVLRPLDQRNGFFGRKLELWAGVGD